jgi:hypothetical protein
MLGPVLLLAGNTTAEVQLSERAANCTTRDLKIEAYSGWNALPRESTAVETSFVNTTLDLREGYTVELPFPAAGFEVV